MYKLTQVVVRAVTTGTLLLLALHLGSSPATAEDFCAVTLNVTASSGQPITSTLVELADATGRIVLRQQMYGSRLRICDFGFGPHTLRVGTNECLPVSVSNLKVVFGHPLVLHVVLDPCTYWDLMSTGCFIYLRTVDEDRKPLAAVHFSPEINRGVLANTDTYGRWQGYFKGAYDVTFDKKGFAPSVARVDCRNGVEVDQEVVMKRTARASPSQ
jgi:hypothetical protein